MLNVHNVHKHIHICAKSSSSSISSSIFLSSNIAAFLFCGGEKRFFCFGPKKSTAMPFDFRLTLSLLSSSQSSYRQFVVIIFVAVAAHSIGMNCVERNEVIRRYAAIEMPQEILVICCIVLLLCDGNGTHTHTRYKWKIWLGISLCRFGSHWSIRKSQILCQKHDKSKITKTTERYAAVHAFSFYLRCTTYRIQWKKVSKNENYADGIISLLYWNCVCSVRSVNCLEMKNANTQYTLNIEWMKIVSSVPKAKLSMQRIIKIESIARRSHEWHCMSTPSTPKLLRAHSHDDRSRYIVFFYFSLLLLVGTAQHIHL